MKNSSYSAQSKFAVAFIAIALIAGLITECSGQEVSITKRDSTHITFKINATSNESIYYREGTVDFKDIAIARFAEQRKIDQSLYDKLSAAGVVVEFGNLIPTKSSPVINANSRKNNNNQIDLGYSQFVKERNTGKICELLGALAVTASVVIIMQRANDAIDNAHKASTKSPQKYPVGLAIAGGGMMAIGFTLDISAGKRLLKH
jgi:hypothetical protein